MNKDEGINGLFRDRLSSVEMEVRDNLWKDIQNDLRPTGIVGQRRFFLSPQWSKVAVAASVVLFVGMASVAFWHFSPHDEIKEAFTQMAVLTPDGNLDEMAVQDVAPSAAHLSAGEEGRPDGYSVPVRRALPVSLVQEDDEDEMITVRFSITYMQHLYEHQCNSKDEPYKVAFLDRQDTTGCDGKPDATTVPLGTSSHTAGTGGKWALKIGMGTALSKGAYKMPLSTSILMERQLCSKWALEAGVQYNYMPADQAAGGNMHTVAVPLKVNLLLASVPKLDLYATAGAMAEKSIGRNMSNDPIRMSVTAGIGVRYRLNNRFALFAEPTVSHSFDTESDVKSLRTERPTNMNLLCGIRMTY